MTDSSASTVTNSELGSYRARTSEHPRIADHVVARPRVTQAVLDAIAQHGRVHVVAPAGAGKTTAVVQAVEALDLPVAWLTLEEWHRSPGRLADHLARALGRVFPGLVEEADRARAGGAGPKGAVSWGDLQRRETFLGPLYGRDVNAP